LHRGSIRKELNPSTICRWCSSVSTWLQFQLVYIPTGRYVAGNAKDVWWSGVQWKEWYKRHK
jgi:hypothetical protein